MEGHKRILRQFFIDLVNIKFLGHGIYWKRIDQHKELLSVANHTICLEKTNLSSGLDHEFYPHPNFHRILQHHLSSIFLFLVSCLFLAFPNKSHHFDSEFFLSHGVYHLPKDLYRITLQNKQEDWYGIPSKLPLQFF